MKPHLFFLLFVCSALSLQGKSQNKSGLILQGGAGNIQSVIEPSALATSIFYDINYQSYLSVGYRFHIKQSGSPLFFNFDGSLGMKSWQARFDFLNPENDPSNPYDNVLSHQSSSQYYFASLTGTVNYSIYKGLSSGVGLEPTYLVWRNVGSGQNHFDVPIVARLAYDFGFLELGLNFKYGLMNLIKTDRIQSGKFRDWQFSLFIPF